MRARYNRFRAWQKNPFRYAMNEGESHRCNNCGHEYSGNFCPLCGQKATLGEVNWESVRESVMEIWGVGTRSMTYTLWQLLWRPGYLIGDYISGRRQVSFPPVKMLLIVAVICSIVAKLTGADTVEAQPEESSNALLAFMDWTKKNQGWGTLVIYSSMILPTWALFHHAPRCTAHSLPQGFFIQVFLSTMVLVFGLLAQCFPPILAVFPVYYFMAYYQLFGYGLWATLWRLLTAVIAMGCIVGIIALIVLDFSEKSDEDTLLLRIGLVTGFSIFCAAILAVGYLIGRWTQRRRCRQKLTTSWSPL